jgi:phytoene synthase
MSMNDPLNDAFAHCEALVREADKDRFLASLFAPAPQRRALLALYAFDAELARIPGVVREPLAGEVRLQWWRDVVAGERETEAGGHPVASALRDVIRRYTLPQAQLDILIDTRQSDLADVPVHDVAELEAYACGTEAPLMTLAERILRPQSPHDALFAGPAGTGVALVRLLRSFPLLAHRGACYVPPDVLGRFGVDPHDVLAGRPSPALRIALAWMREHAAGAFERARPLVAAADPVLTPVWLTLALVPLYLKALQKTEDEPFGVTDVPQWRRQWAMWRAARSHTVPAMMV